MARKLKKKLPKAQLGTITRGLGTNLRNRLSKIAPSIFPTPTPPSILGPMKTIKVGTSPSLSLDDWRSYIKTGNVDSPFPAFYSEKARQHIVPSFAPVDEFGTIGLTGDLVRKESNRFNNLVFDRGLMISPAQGTGRKSVHFTGTGKPVPGHLLGNWDHVTNTFALPISDAIRYNAMPRSTAPNDVYFYSPRQFVYPPSTKILTGDMQLASNARGIGLEVNFNKELFKLNKQINKLEELKNTPGTKYSYNESTSSGNFNSDKYNLYKQEKDLLSAQVKKLTDDWLTGLNLQGIDHLNPAYKLGFRDFDPNLRSDLQRNIRSSSETPYVHSESPEFKYYMEGLKDASGNTVKSRSQRIDENPSLLDDITMEQAKDPAYSLFDNARIYKGGYDKKGMVEPSQADLILYQKQIFSYPKEYVEKILANYDAKNFPKDGPYRKILENYIKDGSAGVKYGEGGENDKNTIAYSRLLKRFIPSAAVLGKNPLLTFAGAMLYPNTLGKGSTLETPSLEQQYQNYLNFTTPEERIKNELEYEVMTGRPFVFDPQPLPNQQDGGALPKAQSGLFKSITNPLGRIRYKFDPFNVTPKSRLLIPTRPYGDVQHKIPSLINQFQRTDTPMLSNLIIPRSNLETGELFATGMGDRITRFIGDGKMLNEPVKLMDGNTRFWLGEQMGENWDNFYRGLQSDNKNLFPEISKFNLKLDYKSDGQLAWFRPDGTEYTDLVNLKKPFPNLIARDKTSPATLLKGPRLIKDRADLENQFNIRNTGYHTVNIHDGLRNNEFIRSQAKKYGYNPDDDRELAMFLGTSPGGSGRRGGFSLPKGYDILFSGNDPKVTLERYGNRRANPFTIKFDLLDANVTGPGGTVFFNTDGANKMPVVTPGFNETNLGLYDRISAFDTKNVNFPQFGITNPFEFNTQLGMSTFKKGLDPKDYQGLIINPNSLQVPGLTQTNLIFGKENVPVRAPRGIFTPDEVDKMKEYGGQTPGLALDDTPDRTYKDGGATRTSLSEYQNGGGPNYNQMLINFIKDQEAGMEYMKAKNSAVMKPDGSGYYKRYEDGKFYPYYHQNADGSFESQATIGYGTKGINVYDMYKEGMSVPEANISLNESLNNAHRKTKIFVDANYGDGFYDKLSDQKKVMLADFTFNLGRLSFFPKFAEGILTDNTDLALAEYIRGEEKGGAELGRNKAYLETFLQPWVDQTKERKKKEAEAEKLRLLNEERDKIMEEKYSSWYSPFVPNSIENLFKQNYDWEDQYFKDKGITTYQDGGQYSNDALRLFSNYQGMLQSSFSEDLRNDVAKTYADALKREGIDVENMSQGQMFNIARAAQEAGYSMPFQEYDTKFGKTNVPQFMYKGKPFGIEEYDDPVNIFRTKEEFDNILKLAQSIPTSYFTNKDIKTEEDYEKAIFDYFGEEGTVPNPLVSRFLRDVKKAGNIGELSYMQSIPQYNLMRDIMNPKYDKAYQELLNEKKLINFFDSKEFNKGTKAFKEWEKRYNSNAMNAFESSYLDQIVGNQYSKERKAFDEYVANNPDGGDNEFYEAIRTGMQNTAALYNITNAPTTYTTPAGLLGTGESTVDYSTFAEGDVPYYMKDARMSVIKNILYPSGQILDPDFNQYENRPKTRFEKSAVTKNWDRLGDYLKYDAFHLGPSGGKNFFNFAFGDLLYGTVDWALDTAKGVLGVDGDKYEAYERFKENPTPGTFGMLGLDVVSFVPIGKGAKILTGLKNTNKSAQFLTKGISNTPGWQNKTNLLYNNLDDLTNLHSLKKAPPTGPFSSISTGTTFNPQFNLGTFNKPKYTPFRESGFLKTPYQIGIIGGGAGTNVLEQYNPNYFENLINSTENNN
tara:strand:+ start:498 stop:6005 length:5508 start_codon:yes stop_codon:yes gene_type:complete